MSEARLLESVYGRFPHVYVLNLRIPLDRTMQERTYFVAHSERDWKVLLNVWEAWRIIRRERPTVIISTGAGVIVPFALVGMLLGIPTIYIETYTSVTRPSLTGRIMRYLATEVIFHWPTLRPYFPTGHYSRGIARLSS